MKSIKIFSVCLAALLGLSSCASSWLDQELTGGTLTQEEYNSMSNVTVGTVKGIYSSFYAVSDHDLFGIKSLDIATDLVSSDLAMTAQAYGWFTSDAQRLTQYRTSYIWSFYFDMVMNANAVLRSLDHKSTLTQEEQDAYAQALAIRAYCYYNLANLYGPAAGDNTTPSVYGKKGKGADYDLAPIYTQNDTTPAGLVKERPLSSYIEVREFVESDLTNAIEHFEKANLARTSKLFIDINVAKALQAYNYLQMAWAKPTDAQSQECYKKGYDMAMSVIRESGYQILPYDDVLTTGFVDVNNPSWMWGLDVTAENYGGLASFWGHIDIHTYSYAYAGATKGMDELLYKGYFTNGMETNDIRCKWFDATKKYIPDWKFYDLKRGVTADEIDRDWKNDVVFLRIEEMYLIAAECAYNMNEMDASRSILKELLVERLKDPSVVDGWNGMDLLKQIYYNWRVELFAEGRGLITFKRFNQYGSADFSQKKRGNNHFAQAGNDMKATDYEILYKVPPAEIVYNSEIND